MKNKIILLSILLTIAYKIDAISPYHHLTEHEKVQLLHAKDEQIAKLHHHQILNALFNSAKGVVFGAAATVGVLWWWGIDVSGNRRVNRP